MMYRKRVLVTGATGFVGSRLIRHLVRENRAISAVIRPSSDLAILNDIMDGISIFPHDGTTAGMHKIMEQAKPNVVYHLASFFNAEHQPEHIVPLIESNILFATQLVEAMIANDVSALVNTGTSWQHYQDHEYNPVCLYAATKQAFEVILTYYADTTPLRVISLKLFDTYGEQDPRRKLLSLFDEAVRTGVPLKMSPGEQLINLVHIDDVIRAFVMAADRLASLSPGNHETYAVSSGRPISLKEVVALYSKVRNKPVPVTWEARPYRKREVMVPWSKGKLLPGWSPKIGLEEGFRRLVVEKNAPQQGKE